MEFPFSFILFFFRACPPELRKEATEVALALIEKCLAGRPTIKEKAVQALLLFLQIALEPVMVRLRSISRALSSHACMRAHLAAAADLMRAGSAAQGMHQQGC